MEASEQLFRRSVDAELDDSTSPDEHRQFKDVFKHADTLYEYGVINDADARQVYRILCLHLLGYNKDIQYLRDM